MLNFARLPKGERDDAVTVVALGMDTHPAIVEKDFWVCWMLRYLFGHANVRTVAAERTFWEKATILHKEAFRTNDNFPARYSRHYYDLFRLSQSGIADSAMADTALLHDVVNFKMTFWRSNVVRYDLCVPGTMRLVPPSGSLGKIREDYESMRRMIYGGVPSFEEVMDGIAALEERINSLAEG